MLYTHILGTRFAAALPTVTVAFRKAMSKSIKLITRSPHNTREPLTAELMREKTQRMKDKQVSL